MVESRTLIDVVIHNTDLISATKVFPCSFSDHCFVVARLDVPAPCIAPKTVIGRKLNEEKLARVADFFAKQQILLSDASNDSNWCHNKRSYLQVLNAIAPLQTIHLRSNNISPWVNDELLRIKGLRDRTYKNYCIYGLQSDHNLYKELCRLHDKITNQNLLRYFSDMTASHFNSSKCYWQFYSKLVTVKSDRSAQLAITSINHNDCIVTDAKTIANLFNEHFISLKSSSNASIDECVRFNLDFIKKLKAPSESNPTAAPRLATHHFSFRPVTVLEVERAILDIPSSSGPGVSMIPTSVIKATCKSLAPALTVLINKILTSGEIPLDWKSAIVTPLHKSRATDSVENYRGLSVLPPIDKVFEKLVGNQISDYFVRHHLLFSGQYGFRSNHSCEAALHEVISKMKNILANKRIGMLLCVDFKSAFNVVHPKLLLTKLEHAYGFDEAALRVLSNYFQDRTQLVKIGDALSNKCSIELGVPQGSSLGPLLFLIFINDLPFFLDIFLSILFADDTTLVQEEDDLEKLLTNFNNAIEQFLLWCRFNLIDINWNKTKIMFVTNKRINIPTIINIDGSEVEVVSSFVDNF